MIKVWLKPVYSSLVDCYFEVIETLTGCERIFLRTRDNNYRIVRSTGHNTDFIRKEDNIRNSDDNDHECLCGMVIRGEEVPHGPSLTEYGSLIISFDEHEREKIENVLRKVKHYRKTCITEEGFCTLAIVPVKSLTDEVVEGLFHITNYDRVEFDDSKIDRLEKISRQFTGILVKIDEILKSKNSEKIKILILEPDGVTAAMINRLLSDMGFQCIAAHRWDVALGIIKSLDIDILITDYALPGIEFEEFIKRVRAPFVKTPPATIMLSTLDGRQNRLFSDFYAPIWIVSKPFGSDEIVTVLTRALASSDLEEKGLFTPRN